MIRNWELSGKRIFLHVWNLLPSQQTQARTSVYIMDLLSVFTYCIQYLALFLFIMTTQFQAIASFYYPSKFLTRLCDRAQTKTGNIQIFINMVLLMTNTQNNKLCLRQLDTSSAIESVTLLLQKYGTSASQIRASTEIMLQDQGRSNFKTFLAFTELLL